MDGRRRERSACGGRVCLREGLSFFLETTGGKSLGCSFVCDFDGEVDECKWDLPLSMWFSLDVIGFFGGVVGGELVMLYI